MNSVAGRNRGRFGAWIRSLCFTLMAMSLSSCGWLITQQGTAYRQPEVPDRGVVVVASETRKMRTVEAVNKFALMALFAKVTYRKDIRQDMRQSTACDYLKAGVAVPDFGMPTIKNANGEFVSGWKRWSGPVGVAATGEVKPCFSASGLDYETYVHQMARGPDGSPGKYDEAVIAFRGTENYGGEILKDWSSNFAAFAGFEPGQYKIAQKEVPKVVAALQKEFDGVRIYATGHSLGGGLAQQASYMSRGIKETFTFDSTPVTNWSFLALHDKDAKERGAPAVIENHDPTIYRVYHRNEGLFYLRDVTTRFNSRRYGRSDYEFFFQDGSSVDLHEMGILACHLAMLIQGKEADHHYPKEYAEKEILARYYAEKQPRTDRPGETGEPNPICPPSVELTPIDAASASGTAVGSR